MPTDRLAAPAAAALAALLLLVTAAPAVAAEEGPAADREKAALAVEEGLMCHCGCTDLTVRVCNCGVAAEIKADIRSRLKDGQTPAEVAAAYVARYGEQIRSAPTREGFNLLAWTMPFVVVIAAGIVIVLLMRRWRAGHAAEAPAAASHTARSKADQAALERVDRAVRDLL